MRHEAVCGGCGHGTSLHLGSEPEGCLACEQAEAAGIGLASPYCRGYRPEPTQMRDPRLS